MNNELEAKMVRAASEMEATTLISYFGTVAGNLALDPQNRELVIEHRILGDELQNRIS